MFQIEMEKKNIPLIPLKLIPAILCVKVFFSYSFHIFLTKEVYIQNMLYILNIIF